MKFLSTLAPLLLSAAVVVDAGIWDKQTALVDDVDKKIPGISPLEHCSTEFAGDILTLEHVNLSPNPPLA